MSRHGGQPGFFQLCNSTDDSLRFEVQWWTSKKPPLIWEDTEAQRIEDRIAEIATQILVTGEAMLRDWQNQRHDDEIKRRAELIERVEQKRAAEERAEQERTAREKQRRVDNLLADVLAWRRAEDIRAYVRARLDNESDSELAAQGGTLEEWTNWALCTANEIDPLSRRIP